MPSETEAVDKQTGYLLLHWLRTHHPDGAFGVEIIEVDGGVNDPLLDGLEGRDGLECSRSAEAWPIIDFVEFTQTLSV
ncbi:hypothetical protein MASR2M79_12460 [Aminivibrio sp.]